MYTRHFLVIRLNVAGVWISLIQVYAPTDDADSLAKDEFYAGGSEQGSKR